MDKIQEFKKIVDQMADTYAKKNENYGDSFGDTYERLGAVSGLVRLYDKLNRATSLVNGGENHYESLEDTFIDMACYAIMNVIELRKEKERDNSEKSLSLTDNYRFIIPYNPNDYTGGTGLVYSSPCHECSRRLQINGCDGCHYNVILTNNCSCTSGGTK